MTAPSPPLWTTMSPRIPYGPSFPSSSPTSPPSPSSSLPNSASASSPSSSAPSSSSSSLLLPPSSTPLTSTSPLNISYIFLSEFDILKGSQLRHQYPTQCGVKESQLAELMLPEGAHLRESDWTIFMINDKMVSSTNNSKESGRERRGTKDEKEKDKDGSSASASPKGSGGSTSFSPSSISTASLASSPSSSSDSSPSSSSFSSDPSPSPLPSSDFPIDPTDCLEGFGQLIVLNLVRTKMDKTVKRGAIVKSMAVATRHRFYNVFKPILMLALDSYFELQSAEEQKALLAQLYSILNYQLDLSAIPKMTNIERNVWRATRLRTITTPSSSSSSSSPSSSSSSPSSLSDLHITTSVKWGNAMLPFRIPICMESDEVLESSVVSLVNRFGENIMSIYTAIFCEKRVLFMGYQQAASDVCLNVLSSCLLVSPPLFGTIHRCFPYANLTNMDFLTTPGYIAGVTNPLFESRQQWWDICCNITNGEVTFSSSYQEELNNYQHGSGDKDGSRMNQLDSLFYNELMSGVKLKYGEEWTRCMFRDYTSHLIHMAVEEELFVDNQTKSYHQEANQGRINSFIRSNQYKIYEFNNRQRLSISPFNEMDSVIRHHIRTLQVKSTSAAEMIAIFTDFFRYVNTREEILEFLSLLPESQGGLFPVAVGLFHKHQKVRAATVELLQRIDAHHEGQKCVSALNYFILLTYYRYAKTSPSFQNMNQQVSGNGNTQNYYSQGGSSYPSSGRETVSGPSVATTMQQQAAVLREAAASATSHMIIPPTVNTNSSNNSSPSSLSPPSSSPNLNHRDSSAAVLTFHEMEVPSPLPLSSLSE